MGTPTLAGVHHLKLPVRDLAATRAWYERRLGYEVEIEFVESGELMGIGMRHPAGGPMMSFRLDPDRAAAAAGFDYFSLGVPDEPAIRVLADRFTALGDAHAGVHWASIGWILPGVTDPDGHEVRFYTVSSHSEVPADGVVHDPRETAEAREADAARARS